MSTGETGSDKRDIWVGGLMRCCIQTIKQLERETLVGDTCTCIYCASIAVVGADGRWRWVPSTQKTVTI